MWKERRKKEEEEERKNNAKFSGHYVRPHTHNVRKHALRSRQYWTVLLEKSHQEVTLQDPRRPSSKF